MFAQPVLVITLRFDELPAVGVFKMSSSLGTFPVNTTSLVGFSEGLFTYAGQPIDSAIITCHSR